MADVSFGSRVSAAVGLPWNAFVAVFVYFTVLSAAVIGGADFATPVMAVAYLLPLSLYVGVLASRAVHALATLDVHFHRAPHAILR